MHRMASLIQAPVAEMNGLVLGTLVLLFGFGRYLVPKALEYLSRHRNREGFMLVVLLAVLVAAWATHEVGLSMALGGFIMGMLLSQSCYVYQVKANIELFKGILMSIFFVAVGMSIEVEVLAGEPWVFTQHVTIILLIKLAVMGVQCAHGRRLEKFGHCSGCHALYLGAA